MITLIENFPWTQQPWHQLTSNIDRLPHALLLSGLRGLGKYNFSIALAELLLCTNSSQDKRCGKCKGCNLVDANTHPDIKIVEPAEAGKSISINQIRDLSSFLVLTPHTASCKVIIITPAESMTLQAANSLLKQLEEPPGNAILMLVSHLPHQLPQTIRSRCTRVDFNAPSTEEATRWLAAKNVDADEIAAVLAAAGGAPSAALELAQQGYGDLRKNILNGLLAVSRGKSPLVCAELWQKIGGELALGWFYVFLLDVLKQTLGVETSKYLVNRDSTTEITQLANQIPANQVAKLLETVSEARRLILTPVDERLILEDILIRWNRVCT